VRNDPDWPRLSRFLPAVLRCCVGNNADVAVTMIRVSPETRDAINEIARNDYGGVSADEALRRLAPWQVWLVDFDPQVGCEQ
jgi:hypothetical protein